MSPQPVSEPPRRSWKFKFTLRTMFVLLTALCVWLAVYNQRARRQQQIVERIRQHGGGWTYDYHHKNNIFRSRSESWVPIWLLDRVGDDFFHSVTGVIVRDELVSDVASLPRLEELMILDEDLTDAELEPLRGHLRLKRLVISVEGRSSRPDGMPVTTRLTDRSLELIGALPLLEEVYVTGDRFSADGLEKLARGRRLVRVHVECCDASVNPSADRPLRENATIRWLSLSRWTRNEGARELAHWTR